ncbi:RNA-binding protein [Achlya hypogyna]|uniref:RNA-binding protein n=1 Tax=Achlya hypogyna TaxID=1202772 RepID=A0A1V9ZDC4_ACHHY|nr:RNA-binding protein [Achlya hypogyna]
MAGDEYKVGSIAASFGAATKAKKTKATPEAEPANALASFFSTSQKIFAKKPEPKIVAPVIPVVKSTAPVKETPAEETPEVKAPKVVLFDGEGPKKVKKPKHSKVKPEAAAPEPRKDDDEDDEKAPRTIFVGNVSLEATAEELKKFFSSCGKVESARLRSLPVAGCAVDQHGKQNLVKKVCANKKLFVEGRDNCNAYVVFASEESIEKALALNGAEFHEKKLRVDRKVPTIDAKRTVFVGNVAFTATEDDLRRHFEANIEKDDEDEGSALVESVRLIRDKDTHLGKGFGYVLLKDVPTATKALKLNGSKIGKRELRVSVCGKRFKSTAADKTPRTFEGRRAKPAPGAQMRVVKKRKLEEASVGAKKAKWDPKTSGKKAADGKKPAPKKFDGKKPTSKKFDGKKPAPKKFDKKVGKKTAKKTFEKPKKPKHAARKARQALEAQMAAAAK